MAWWLIPCFHCLRDEAPEEKAMKDEIESLRKKLQIVKASGPDPESIADEIASAAEDVEAKVSELSKLKLELDEKVRGRGLSASRQPGLGAPSTCRSIWRVW